MTEPTTTPHPAAVVRHPTDPTYTIDDITEIGWDLAATVLDRNALHRELAAVADAAGLTNSASARLIATTVRQLRQERDHLAAEYRRVVDELDVCRAARDRYQRATPADDGHRWTVYGTVPCCASCGMVRRRDGANKPCRGPAPITLRADEPAQTPADGPAPSGPDLSTVIAQRIASANLAGPANTVLARATIAVDAVLDACRDSLVAAYGDEAVNWALDAIDREDLAKAVLDTVDEPADVDQLIDDTRQALVDAADEDERAEAIADLLDGWYSSWPTSAVTDPHQPLAQQLLRLLRVPADGQDDPDTTLLDGVIAAERRHADDRVAAVDKLLEDTRDQLERVRAERDERLTLAESSRLAKLVDQARAGLEQIAAAAGIFTAANGWTGERPTVIDAIREQRRQLDTARADLATWRIAAENRAARLALTLREILDAVEWTPEGWAALCVDRAAFDRWRAALADTGTHDQQPTDDPAPTGRQCDALCRDIETERDRMAAVVTAARAWRHAAGLDDGAAELVDAVDTYEATPGIAPTTSRPTADDVHLTGPTDTPLGRATVALAARLDGCCLDIDAEEVAKVALDAAFPDDGYHQPDYADPSWSSPADHRAEATALLQVATEPPETRDWTADPTHVLLAAIAHAILATVPAPQPAAEQGNAEVDRLRAGLLDRSIQPDPWAALPEDVIDTALAAIDRLLRLVQAAADWRGRYVAAGSPDWPLHGPIATTLDELLRDWPGVDLSVPAAGDGSDEVFDADDYPEDYPDDGGMPRNPATPPAETAVEWGVRAHHRDGATADYPREDEDDARSAVRTIRQYAADEGSAEDWTGAELIRRAVAVSPWEVVPDGPETAPSATHSPEQPSAGTTGPANPAQGN